MCVGVGVGVRLGMIGVMVGVNVGLSGELSPKLRRGSIVALGGGGVKVAGTTIANDSSFGGCGRERGETSVGKAGCSIQAA